MIAQYIEFKTVKYVKNGTFVIVNVTIFFFIV